MRDITEEISIKNMEQKGKLRDLEQDSSTDHLNKDSEFTHDYSVHCDDHNGSKWSGENFPSEHKGSLPVQCTEDNFMGIPEVGKLQNDSDPRLKSEDDQHSQVRDDQHSLVRVSVDDVDLPHERVETKWSEHLSSVLENELKSVVCRIITVERKQLFTEEELGLQCTEEEETNKKLSASNPVESGESAPLDVRPFLKLSFHSQNHCHVYMLHGYTAQVSSPDGGHQLKVSGVLQKQCHTEMNRLATYINYPSDLPVFAITLAGDGFVFHHDLQSVECFFCKLRISLSELRAPGADPVKMHRTRSPHCSLKLGEDCGNVPVPKVGENGFFPSNSGTVSEKVSDTNTHSQMNGANGSRDRHDERPSDLWYQADRATVSPSPVVQRNSDPNIATDSAPSIEVMQMPSSLPATNTSGAGFQPKMDSVNQNPRHQQPSLPPTASSAKTTHIASSLQHSEATSAPVNPSGSVSEDSRARPSSSASNSRQNRTAQSASAQSGTASATAANPPKNSKSSKKTKSAKKSEPASRRPPPGASTSLPSVSASAPNASNRGNSSSSSGKGDQGKEKKLTYSELGIFADKPKRADLASLQKRLATFEGKWKTSFAKTPQILAECGMYYAGYSDCARCFFCGGGLKNWEDPDEPWVEHARWFPKCAYVLLCKSPMFVEIVQRKNKSNEKILIKDVEEEINQKTKSMDIPASSLPASTSAREARTSSSQSQDIAGSSEVIDLSQLEAEHEELTSQVTCKICMDERSSVVFLPCGHMVACTDCAVVLKNCPLCRADIRGTVKAQI